MMWITNVHVGCCCFGFLSLVDLSEASNCTYSSDRRLLMLLCHDVIPEHIHIDTDLVSITCFKRNNVITEPTFQGRGWGNITSLELFSHADSSREILVKTRGLSRLKHLKHLRIHHPVMVIEESAFLGLHHLISLDLTDVINVTPGQLLANINAEYFPNLEKLTRVRTGTNSSIEFEFGDLFWRFIDNSQIRFIDISGMNIANFSIYQLLKQCTNLQVFKTEGTLFSSVNIVVKNFTPCYKLRVNFATAVIKKIRLMCSDSKNFFQKRATFELTQSYRLLHAKFRIIENACSAYIFELSVEHLILDSGVQLISEDIWNITSLSLRNNRLINIYIKHLIVNSTLRELSLANTSLVFIHPEALSRITSRIYLDISLNNLQVMNVHHPLLFERLL